MQVGHNRTFKKWDWTGKNSTMGSVCVCVCACVCVCVGLSFVGHRNKVIREDPALCMCYGVASVSKIDNIIGFFCKRTLCKRQYSAKETYNLIDPTDRSHPIWVWFVLVLSGHLSPRGIPSTVQVPWVCTSTVQVPWGIQHCARAMGWLRLVGSLKL